jgi:hypothetical protein
MTSDRFWGEPLFGYTRADALRDGVLLDITEAASVTKSQRHNVKLSRSRRRLSRDEAGERQSSCRRRKPKGRRLAAPVESQGIDYLFSCANNFWTADTTLLSRRGSGVPGNVPGYPNSMRNVTLLVRLALMNILSARMTGPANELEETSV